jgi:protein-disulfide isomerase
LTTPVLTRRAFATLAAAAALAAPKGALAAPAPETTTDMAALLKPGPLADLFYGKVDAPVTIIEYGSATCPHCARFAAETLPKLKTEYFDTGKVKMIFREYARNPLDGAAFALARCLGDDKALAADELLFRLQDKWAFDEGQPEPLLAAMRPTGLSHDKGMACLRDQAVLDGFNSARDRVNKAFAFSGTPTFIIDGKVYSGELSVEDFDTLLKPLVK